MSHSYHSYLFIPIDISILLYSLFIPFPIIFCQVGEHLLSLVQELEAFSSSDALPDLLSLAERSQSLTILTTLSARGWKSLKIALDFREEDEVELLCKRSVCATAVMAAEKGMFGAQLSKVIEDQVVENNDNNGGMAKRLSMYPSIYLSICLSISFSSHLPSHVVNFPLLS